MYPRDLPVLASPAPPIPLTTAYSSQQYAPSGMSMEQIFSILWAYRKLSLLITLAVVVIVGAACALWPRTYQSTATLMVNFEVNDPLGGREFPTGLLGSYMSTQVELARGSEVLQPVINRLNLTRNKSYTAGHSGDAASLRDWIETNLRKKLLVEQGRYGSQLIYVTYSAGRPAEAAQVANAVAEIYAEQQYRRLTGPAAERARRYTQQLSELRNKVASAQAKVTEFRRANGLVDAPGDKLDVDAQLLFTLEQRLQEAQNARRSAEARSSTDQSVGSQVLGSTMIQSLKSQLAIHTTQLAELRSSMGEQHPQILSLQSQIAAIRRQLNAEIGAYSSNASSELASSRQLEQKLQQAIAEQRSGVVRLRQLQDSGSKHQLELDAAQTVYKRALDGYDQVMFASAGGYKNIDFVSRAKAASRPSKPKVKIAMLLAVFSGLGIGIFAPLLYEVFNRRVRCRDDMERDHGIPVLAELGSLGNFASISTGRIA